MFVWCSTAAHPEYKPCIPRLCAFFLCFAWNETGVNRGYNTENKIYYVTQILYVALWLVNRQKLNDSMWRFSRPCSSSILIAKNFLFTLVRAINTTLIKVALWLFNSTLTWSTSRHQSVLRHFRRFGSSVCEHLFNSGVAASLHAYKYILAKIFHMLLIVQTESPSASFALRLQKLCKGMTHT